MAGDKGHLNTEAFKQNEAPEAKELLRLADELNKLMESDEGKRKLGDTLDSKVGEFLGKLKDGDMTRIQELYKNNPDAQASLERLFSLADLKGKDFQEVQDEQREINVLLEATKEFGGDLSNLENEVFFKITDKVNQLFRDGEYQKALDNTVYLLFSKDKTTAFAMIKQILKSTPAAETLMIKDKKITPSQRREWIKKMDDNIETAAREFEASYYQDLTISGVDAWSLDETQATKKRSEKRSFRDLERELSGDKKISKLAKRLNMPSAFSFIEEHFDDIKGKFHEANQGSTDIDLQIEAFNKLLSKKYFIENGYVPKNGADLKTGEKWDELPNKEWEALRTLCLYKIQTIGSSEEAQADRSTYDYLSGAQIAGVTMSELAQARGILEQIQFNDNNHIEQGLKNGNTPMNVLMTLLGDLNRDGRVTNASVRTGVVREGLDKGTVSGGALASMLEGAILRSSEEQVMTNVESVIQKLHGLSSFTIEPKTILGLINAFKKNPSALIAFREKLKNEPAHGMNIFYEGSSYVDEHLNRLDREEGLQKTILDFIAKAEDPNSVENLKGKLPASVLNDIGELTLSNLETYKNSEKFSQLGVSEQGIIEGLISLIGVEQSLNSAEDKILEELEKISVNLIKFKETDTYKSLKEGEKQNFDKMVDQLSTPEGRKKFISEKDSVKNMYRNFVVSGIGMQLSAIDYDGNTKVGVGVSGGISNEKFNAALSKFTGSVLTQAEVSAGLYYADGEVSLGLGIGTGAVKYLGENVRVFYNVGAGWSPFNPNGLGFSAVIGEETNITPSADESLDLKSPNYIGVAGAYGIGLNLSNRDLDVSSVSGQISWRKDKLAGVENQARKVKEKMMPLFTHLFKLDSEGDITPRTIVDALQGNGVNAGGEFSGFKNTKGDTLYRVATKMYDMYSSYRGKLKGLTNQQAVIDRIAEDFAISLAQNMRNENIEKIVDEGLHIAGASIGVTLGFARLFTGFFLNGGITLRSYEESEYKDNPEMLDRAKKGMENPDNYSIITNEGGYDKKMEIINKFLGKEVLSYSEEAITLSDSVFDGDLHIICNPELAKYLIKEEGKIKIPANADISLSRILYQDKKEFTLILGSKSSNGCKELVLEEKQLKWKDKEETTAISSLTDHFDEYNLTEKIEQIDIEAITLDGKPSETLVNYLENHGQELVSFRNSGRWSNFMKYIKEHPERKNDTNDDGSKFIENAKKLIPSGIANEITSIDDVRFVYASLSRVSQTMEKQLSDDALKEQANKYLEAIRSLSNTQKNTIRERINNPELLNDHGTREQMRRMLVNNDPKWYMHNHSGSNEGRLFNLLTPNTELVRARTDSYKRSLAKLGYNQSVIDEIVKEGGIRDQALDKIKGQVNTAHGTLFEGYIGAVAGYQAGDKFVASPKLIGISEGGNNTVQIPENRDLEKTYLENLGKSDLPQLMQIKSKVIAALGFKEELDQSGTPVLSAALPKGVLISEEEMNFVKALINAKTPEEISSAIVEGKTKDSPIVSFDMRYGFFADCVNETILLGSITCKPYRITRVWAESDVRYYDAVVTADAVTVANDFTLGVTYGQVKPKKLDEKKKPVGPEAPTKPTEGPESSTKPIVDCDGLSEIPGIESVNFDCSEFTYEGTTYSYYFQEVDGVECMIAYDPANPSGPDYIVFQTASGLDFKELDDSFKWTNLPDNAIEVGFPNEEEMQKYEEAMRQYDIDLDIYEKEMEEYKEYVKKYSERIKNIEEARRPLIVYIMYLNFRIDRCKPNEREALLKEVEKLKAPLRSAVVKRAVEG